MEGDFARPWEVSETYDEHSSITDVDGLDTPLLVTAGGQDWRYPTTQLEQLSDAAREQGIDSKLVVYHDKHNAIGVPDRAIHRLEQLEA